MSLFRDVPRPAAWPLPRDRAGVHAALRYGRERDPIGHHAHTVIAMTYLFLLPWTTAPKDVAFIVLGLYALTRVHCTIQACLCLLRDRVGLLLLAWTGWHALSMLWSRDLDDGLDEVRTFRVVLTTLMIWPILDRVGLLVAAFLAGVLVENGVQLLQGLELFGLHPDVNERLHGLVHPIHAGTACLAALCWHLSAALRARGWVQGVSIAAMLAAAAGLLASGSRGPWLAAAASLPLMLVVIAVNRPATRKLAIALGVVGIVGAAAMWPIAGPGVVRRSNEALADLRASFDGELDSNLGVRFGLWKAAWDLGCAEPLTGVGAGELGEGIKALGRSDLLGEDASHAHSLYLHEFGTAGIPGVVLATLVVVFAIRRAFRDPPDTAWSLGTPYVLVGWAVAALFDAYHMSGNMFGLFAFALAIVTPHRPPAAPTALPRERDPC